MARVAWLGERQLFRDEAATWTEARYPLPELLAVAQGEPYPPLYAVLMHGWMTVAGDAELALRLPSVVAGLLTMAIGWRWASEALGRWPALVVAALLALSPLAVANAREARMYALEACFATAAWWLTWRLVAGRVDGTRQTAVHAAALAAVAAGELWTGPLGIAVGGLQGLLALGGVVAASRGGLRSARGPIAAVVGLLVGLASFLPWLPGMLALAVDGQPYWTPPPGSFDWAVSPGQAILGWREDLPGYLVLRAALLALAMLGGLAAVRDGHPERRGLGAAVLLGAFAFPFLVWAVSQARSIYDTRYLGALVAPLALGVAAGLVEVARLAGGRSRAAPAFAAVLSVALLAASGLALYRWLGDWRAEVGMGPARQLVAELRPRLRTGDVVLATDARSWFPIAYGAHRAAVAGSPLPAPVLDWDSGVEPAYRGASLIPPALVVTPDRIRAAGGWRAGLPGLRDGSSIWLVTVVHGHDEKVGFAPLVDGELTEAERLIVTAGDHAGQARRLDVP